jgi:hypothetical protein
MARVYPASNPNPFLNTVPSTFPAASVQTSRRANLEADFDVQALEVMVAWGDCVIGVVHHMPPKTVTLGEANVDGSPCDFLVPRERLGFDCLPIVEVTAGVVEITLPGTADGMLEEASGVRVALERLRHEAVAHPVLAGAQRYTLRHLERIVLRLGVFTVTVSATPRLERPKRAFADSIDKNVLGTFAATLFAVGAWMSSLAYFVPPMGLEDEASIDDDQVRMIQQYLTANAERNRVLEELPQETQPDDSERGGHAGHRSPGDEGKTGSLVSKNTQGRLGIIGEKTNTDVHLGKAEMLEMARNFGMVELLGSLNTAASNGLSSPWGHDVASGRDDVAAMGQLFGASIGDSAGFGGIGLSGTGQGGGCVGGGCGAGIGMNNVGTIGGGQGYCDPTKGPCDGMGRGNGLGNGRGHRTRPPRIRPNGTTIVSGRLPPEVIQRIVRQNYGRFRFCYEQGLVKNPNLAGRVAVRFIIGRDGAVSNAQNGGSDLPDAQVNGCIIQSFYGLSFPAPEGGVVTVSYPIQLQPE